nr:hypothetical protein [uncultured Psychroserpens sp.]
MEDFKQQFEDELKTARENTVLSPEYRRKKLIMYVIRTIIAIVLFYIFWEHQWVKWLLYVYIPLNLIFLVSIFGMPYFLNKKINKTKEQIDELDDLSEDWEEE